MNRDRTNNQFPILKLNDSIPSSIAIPPRKSTKNINFLKYPITIEKPVLDESDLNQFRTIPRKKKEKEKRLSMTIEKPTFEEFVANLRAKLGVPDDLGPIQETSKDNNDRDTVISNNYVSPRHISERETMISNQIIYLPTYLKSPSQKNIAVSPRSLLSSRTGAKLDNTESLVEQILSPEFTGVTESTLSSDPVTSKNEAPLDDKPISSRKIERMASSRPNEKIETITRSASSMRTDSPLHQNREDPIIRSNSQDKDVRPGPPFLQDNKDKDVRSGSPFRRNRNSRPSSPFRQHINDSNESLERNTYLSNDRGPPRSEDNNETQSLRNSSRLRNPAQIINSKNIEPAKDSNWSALNFHSEDIEPVASLKKGNSSIKDVEETLEIIKASTAFRRNKSFENDYLSSKPLMLRIVISKSPPLYHSISRTFSFEELLEVLRDVISKQFLNSRLVLLAYRKERSSQNITLYDEKGWHQCKVSVNNSDKVNLFVNLSE